MSNNGRAAAPQMSDYEKRLINAISNAVKALRDVMDDVDADGELAIHSFFFTNSSCVAVEKPGREWKLRGQISNKGIKGRIQKTVSSEFDESIQTLVGHMLDGYEMSHISYRSVHFEFKLQPRPPSGTPHASRPTAS